MNLNRTKIWIQASRLRAFPLAASCIAMGGFLAAEQNSLNWPVLIMAIVTAVLLQLLSNFANDLGDAQHGADHEEREGPQRTVQKGDIRPEQMKLAVKLVALASFLSGLILIFLGLNTLKDVVIFLALGIVAILAAIGYTMGRRPYGYLGLGDLSVFVFFGWVGVVGTYYLQTHQLDPLIFLPASACSFFAVAVLNVNNIRDIDSDRKAGKFTFALRLGKTGARYYHLALLTGGMLTAAAYTILQDGSWLFVLASPLVAINAIKTFREYDARALDPLVRQMAFTSLIFVILFGVGIII